MKTFLCILAAGALGTLAGAQPAPPCAAALAADARAALERRDLERSARLHDQLLACAPVDLPRSLGAAAASFALTGRPDAAFDALSRVVADGFLDADALAQEEDFAALHADPRWPALLERTRAGRRGQDRLWGGAAFRTPYRPDLSEDEKVAGLSKYWMEVKLNFANFDLVPDLDWDALYLETLPKVRRTRSTAEYYRVLKEMNARLQDGHTNLMLPDELRPLEYQAPLIRTRLIEGEVLVLAVWDEELARQGVVPGLEVVAVDGMPVREYAERRVVPFEAVASPQDRDSRTYDFDLLLGPPGSVELTLRDARGALLTRSLPRLPPDERRRHIPPLPPVEVRWLPGNVARVAVNTFGDPEAADRFEAVFDEIAKADALILDFRENGGGDGRLGVRILGRLTDKPFKNPTWRTRDYRPIFRISGYGEGTYGQEAPELTPAGAAHYAKPVALLTSARTYSAGEDFAVMFDMMDRGPIVGEPTGGSTGQPLTFDLPGGGKARVCAKRDTYPDGREILGRGVQPDLPVHPTVEDVRAGRDPVLEAALRALGKP